MSYYIELLNRIISKASVISTEVFLWRKCLNFTGMCINNLHLLYPAGNKHLKVSHVHMYEKFQAYIGVILMLIINELKELTPGYKELIL